MQSRLSSDVTSKDATLQVVYDVLKLTPFLKAFNSANVLEDLHARDFWASSLFQTSTALSDSMNNKKPFSKSLIKFNDDDSDNEVKGVDVEGEKSDEDATYLEDQGNEADRDTNANLEGRDDVKADVVFPQVQATQEIEDTHVTLTPVNPDGQQQSSSVSSGFVTQIVH
ncbi:hypothetical protein Tco_1390438 [Tanacetum coccineum]